MVLFFEKFLMTGLARSLQSISTFCPTLGKDKFSCFGPPIPVLT